MNKIRLAIVIAMLTVTLSMFGLGVYTGLTGTNGVKNQVIFNRGDDNVFVSISSEYSGPKLKDGLSSTFNFVLDRDNADAYDDTNSIPVWELGNTNFKTTETVISFTFTISNINGAGGSLDIVISDFAYDPEQKFETCFLYADNVTSLNNENGALLASDNPLTLSVADGQQISFRLVYTLKKFDTKFKFNNNIKITLTNNEPNN